MMTKIATQQTMRIDWIKWTLVVLMFIGGIAANYYYIAQAWPIRLIGWMVLIFVMGGIALQTQQGKQLISFARESRVELRKVYWPTRQETVQTTLIVAAMVVVLALLLWGVDSLLVWLIGWITGQRG